VRKLVREVAHLTFSGAVARRRGQKVLYVTERSTFSLVLEGLQLIEVAPGVNVQRDVLDRMDFAPIGRELRSYPRQVIA